MCRYRLVNTGTTPCEKQNASRIVMIGRTLQELASASLCSETTELQVAPPLEQQQKGGLLVYDEVSETLSGAFVSKNQSAKNKLSASKDGSSQLWKLVIREPKI